MVVKCKGPCGHYLRDVLPEIVEVAILHMWNQKYGPHVSFAWTTNVGTILEQSGIRLVFFFSQDTSRDNQKKKSKVNDIRFIYVMRQIRLKLSTESSCCLTHNNMHLVQSIDMY